MNWIGPPLGIIILLLVMGAVSTLATAYTAVVALRGVPDPQWSSIYRDLLDSLAGPQWVTRLVAKVLPAAGIDDTWTPVTSSRQWRLHKRLPALALVRRQTEADEWWMEDNSGL